MIATCILKPSAYRIITLHVLIQDCFTFSFKITYKQSSDMWIIIGAMYLCVFCGRERKGPVDYADTFHLSLASGPPSLRKLAGAGR